MTYDYLFIAKQVVTGEILTRDGVTLVGTRDEWARLPRLAGDLEPATGHPATAAAIAPIAVWRPGRRVPIHGYEDTTPVFTAVTAEYAAEIVAAHNGVRSVSGVPLTVWENHSLCIYERERQIAFALRLPFARRIVADHNARLGSEETE